MEVTTSNRTAATRSTVAATDLERALGSLADFTRTTSSDLDSLVHSLRLRLRSQKFQLAIVGQFKRGKSTLINALLGIPVLPTAVVPLTAIPVFISWESSPRVVVRFLSGSDEQFEDTDPQVISALLSRFVTEEKNPKNHLNVERVELYYPAPLLQGLVLIDTPGVGSTHQHNSDTALRTLSECDAAIFVLSVDPPITEVEVEYLRQVQAAVVRLLFVLNKIDYLPPSERSQVRDFIRKTLENENIGGDPLTIYEVSARQGLGAKQRGDLADLTSSGVSRLEEHISSELVEQKVRLLRDAIRRKAAEIASRCITDAKFRIKTIEMPIGQLESKCDEFKEVLTTLERQRRIHRDVLDGEKRRIKRQLEDSIETLRRSAHARLAANATQPRALRADPDQLPREMEATFDDARQQLSLSFRAAVEIALQVHQGQIVSLIDEVRRIAGTIFETPFQSPLEPDSFSFGEDPYWVTEQTKFSLLPTPSRLLNRLLPSHIRDKRRSKRALADLDELILRNAEHLRWAILRGVDETFRRACVTFDRQFDDAIATTDGVVREALNRRQTEAFSVHLELERLNHSLVRLYELQRELTPKIT